MLEALRKRMETFAQNVEGGESEDAQWHSLKMALATTLARHYEDSGRDIDETAEAWAPLVRQDVVNQARKAALHARNGLTNQVINLFIEAAEGWVHLRALEAIVAERGGAEKTDDAPE